MLASRHSHFKRSGGRLTTLLTSSRAIGAYQRSEKGSNIASTSVFRSHSSSFSPHRYGHHITGWVYFARGPWRRPLGERDEWIDVSGRALVSNGDACY